MKETSQILTALASAHGEAAALATLIGVEGSSYRQPGARLLVWRDGSSLGSISGGCLEEDLVLRAKGVIATGRAEIATYDTTNENDLVWGVGLGCQGVVRVLIEPMPAERPNWTTVLGERLRAGLDSELAVVHGGDGPWGTRLASELAEKVAAAPVFRHTVRAPPALLICGAGNDVLPLARMAKELDWHVTLADSRSGFASAARFPQVDRVLALPAGRILEALAPRRNQFAVVMTHRYADDRILLRALLPQPLTYVGLLGPRRRTDRLLAQLAAEGFSPDPSMVAKLHAPVGLDLGGGTAETVALAILAEMQCCLEGRAPIHLRDLAAPIHRP